MIDKSIPYCNIIMKYDGAPLLQKPALPSGFAFSSFRPGDERMWARMEVDNNDFDTAENAITYFTGKYLSESRKLQERFIGVRDKSDSLCGAVICWDDDRNGESVSTVHWLVTSPAVQGQGIGKALTAMLIYRFSELQRLPIYLHTQPWSFIAVGIYSDAGFRLMRTDSFNGYVNQSAKALDTLQTLMPSEKFLKLVTEML